MGKCKKKPYKRNKILLSAILWTCSFFPAFFLRLPPCAKASAVHMEKPEPSDICAATIDSGENLAISAKVNFKNYKRNNPKLWQENFIRWELYNSETLIIPSGHMSISYTLYVPADYFHEMDSALSVVHGAVLVDQKYQYMGKALNRGESWFEPTCDGNGGLAMLRWDMAVSVQADAGYADCKKVGDFFVVKVKNAPLSSHLDYNLSKFISSSDGVYIIPEITIYGIQVSGKALIRLDDVTVKSGRRVLFQTDCQDIGQEDGLCHKGIKDTRMPVKTAVIKSI